jgi:hypothetical protein
MVENKMNSTRLEIGDEDNRSFVLPESVLENLKPGLLYGEEKLGNAAEGHVHGAEVHHRFPRSERKAIPQGSLAERIRKAAQGG